MAWCYVKACKDCEESNELNGTNSCSEGTTGLFDPWAYCHADGYAHNRPLHGRCPQVHECTARPLRGGTKDEHVVDLFETLGHHLPGWTTRVYEPVMGKPKKTWEHVVVNYTYCLPLGEYSRILWTGLFVPGSHEFQARYNVPVNESSTAFSSDIFYSMSAQDFHFKFDMQLYSAFDASYVDGLLWIDMLQPFGKRTSFPLQIPFIRLLRGYRSCLGETLFTMHVTDFFLDLPPKINVCFCYTLDFGIYLSLKSSLLGVSIPFAKEIHIATIHVQEREREQVFAGISAGRLHFTPQNKTKGMPKLKELTTWELTKMVVELDRYSILQDKKNNDMEARLAEVEAYIRNH